MPETPTRLDVAPKTVPRPDNPLISCVIPAFNEAANLAELVPELCEALAWLSPRHEIIVVDDGSRDETAAVAIGLSNHHPVSLVQLSRNFGKENALTAGLDYAHGDVVILMDADFQHPVEVLQQFMEHWRRGYDMVYGVRSDREDESATKRRLTSFFYKLMSRGSEVPIEPDAGDFRLLDRKVVTALRSLPERSRMMKGLYAWVGFHTISIPFKVSERRAGRSNFSFRQLSELALTGLTSFTNTPLRVWAGIGAVISLLSIVYGLYVAADTLIFGADVPGWATLAVGITFLGGMQLLSIGVLGEYIARIFTEVKGRPLYVVSRFHSHGHDTGPGTRHGSEK